MIFPLKTKPEDIRLNKTLHGRSVYRKKDVPGHNCILGYSKPGTGDGIDLFEDPGKEVYACHAGKVTRVFGRAEDKLCGCYIEGDGIITVYAHINRKACVVKGVSIFEGQAIGYIGRMLLDPHLHFECRWKGKSITGETPAGMLKHLIEVLQ